MAQLRTEGAVVEVPANGNRTFETLESALFRALDTANKGRIDRQALRARLAEAGLSPDDPRLRQSLTALGDVSDDVERDAFAAAIRPNIRLIERALQGKLVVPDFADFCAALERIHTDVRGNRDGRAASYIPQLDLPEPELDSFGVSLCTIDGQRFDLGDAETPFTVQSTCKPINYCMALEEHGSTAVHAAIGHEPSGVFFNELALDKRDRPHNPMINAGAIMSSSLIHLTDKRAGLANAQGFDARSWSGRRFDAVMARWQAACGGQRPRFSTSVYLSERQTADRNFALAYYMREHGAFDPEVDLHDVLDFYFQCCSIEMTTAAMAVVAATLANGGICPTTGERVFSTETVRNCLSLMSSCGMYDFSGEFAFTIGLPAKSSVSGALLVVVPNVGGFCIWSPRLDEHGNTVRGIEFCRRLVETFNLHNYDTLTGVSDKRDPRVSRSQQQSNEVTEVVWAASKGDLHALQDQLSRGASLVCADYDLRTPLHLAAAEGQQHIVQLFVDRREAGDADIDINPRDRWGGTPLDDAVLQGHEDIAEMLRQAGARPGRGTPDVDNRSLTVAAFQGDTDRTAELIWAASKGDLDAIYRLVAQGVRLDAADYDLRTPLHLAASEGHLAVVQYLIAHGVDPNPRDRWRTTPMTDAQRHGFVDVAGWLELKGGNA